MTGMLLLVWALCHPLAFGMPRYEPGNEMESARWHAAGVHGCWLARVENEALEVDLAIRWKSDGRVWSHNLDGKWY